MHVGQEVIGPVEVGAIAHGGHCVARHNGRVIFVRHALPGERVMLMVTDTSHDRFWRADAVEVIQASPDRVSPRCAIAGPGLCGGCDFQHVDLAAQRRLKADVVAEQLERLAGVDWAGEVEDVSTPTTSDGLGWRKRMRYHADHQGRAGLRAHRSRRIVPLPDTGCPLAAPDTARVVGQQWPPGAELLVASATNGGALFVDGELGSGTAQLVERAAGRNWSVSADGFFQVHPQAPDVLAAAVLGGLDPQAGETAFDLYCGVGLFTGALADRGCEVWGVESSRVAVQSAQRNLSDVADRVHLSIGRVDRRLAVLPKRTDLIVLDPPRAGAGRAVMQAIAARRPRAIAYVACDPAALARDLATATQLGYEPDSIRAFDLFPMTHHVECVAILHTGSAT
ncbi:MAG: class I SAM-dependent RNA methyltransferase [Propionibacteriaceae bacterium]|nr:class I SAM-dependent RNA methyltransferase [Propionibacteriaceae bacterium]